MIIIFTNSASSAKEMEYDDDDDKSEYIFRQTDSFLYIHLILFDCIKSVCLVLDFTTKHTTHTTHINIYSKDTSDV